MAPSHISLFPEHSCSVCMLVCFQKTGGWFIHIILSSLIEKIKQKSDCRTYQNSMLSVLECYAEFYTLQ